MFRVNTTESGQPGALDLFDRVVILYLVLPLLIFLFGWLELWAALPLALCVLYALKPLADARPARPERSEGNPEKRQWRDAGDGPTFPISRMQLTVALLFGCTWTLLGGIGHFVFANSDWHIRDAVLHDLVVSPWPVGYGPFQGRETLLRAPLGYYLPAALVGKLSGLWMAHLALALWTATGATLFLLQVLSLMPARIGAAVAVAAVVVGFSGFDIVGEILSNPRFLTYWNIAQHLEWWAGSYQYSSMTTQLFWVPNHALAGWLTIGLLCRDSRRSPRVAPLALLGIPSAARRSPLDALLPIIVVAAALWSPLSALGLVPFILLKVLRGITPGRLLTLVHPRVWGPALVVGAVIASYLVLDSSRLPVRLNLSDGDASDVALDVLRQLQFFLLEAGLIGFVVLALRWSWEVVLALVVLLILPIVNFGPGNDLVMRASIPSLAVLAIGVCAALTRKTTVATDSRKKLVLACMMGVGAVTPVQEVARAIVLPAWPVNLEATLIGAACGVYPPHYTARLNGQMVSRLLRQPQRIPLGPQGTRSCVDPAFEIMVARKLK
jgi:hypothetical protein